MILRLGVMVVVAVMVAGAATAPGFPAGEYKYRRRGAIGRQFSSRVRGGQVSRDSESGCVSLS